MKLYPLCRRWLWMDKRKTRNQLLPTQTSSFLTYLLWTCSICFNPSAQRFTGVDNSIDALQHICAGFTPGYAPPVCQSNIVIEPSLDSEPTEFGPSGPLIGVGSAGGASTGSVAQSGPDSWLNTSQNGTVFNATEVQSSPSPSSAPSYVPSSTPSQSIVPTPEQSTMVPTPEQTIFVTDEPNDAGQLANHRWCAALILVPCLYLFLSWRPLCKLKTGAGVAQAQLNFPPRSESRMSVLLHNFDLIILESYGTLP